MWDIAPGIAYACNELMKDEYRQPASRRLALARQYSLFEWIPWATRSLLLTPLAHYSDNDKDNLGFRLYDVLATAKEAIEAERKRLVRLPPYPPSFDNAPFCNQHEICEKVWITRWFLKVVPRINSAINPIYLNTIPDVLEELKHQGMKDGCKKFVIDWLKGSDHLQKEESIICTTINTVREMFN